MKLIIICAKSQNGTIGKDNTIPWRCSEELKHFRRTTLGYPVLMGRKTWESLGKPLKDRINLIISRGLENPPFENTYVFRTIEDALNFCQDQEYRSVFIIGGANIYQSLIEKTDEMIISEMKFQCEGDAFFPGIDESTWEVESEENYEEFNVKHYKRRNASH